MVIAVQRLTLAQIETAILQIFGYSASTNAPWATAANLYLRINEYLQRLPGRLGQVAAQLRAEGERLPFSGVPRFDMWRTQANLTATSGSATVHFPADYDHYIGFWDSTNSRPVYPIETVGYFHEDLRTQSAGPPEYIELLGFVTNGSTWVRQGLVWPPTASGITPVIQCTYWRLPATMPGTTPTAEYPDIDPKWESIAIYGTVVDLSRPSEPEFSRYQQLEHEMLMEMARSARGV